MKAIEDYNDPIVGQKKSGEVWMIQGPCRYSPPIEVEVQEQRKAIIMDKNQGIYVRDLDRGHVRIQKGETYMLKTNEVLVEKEIPPEIESLLAADVVKDKTRAITIKVRHNEAIHINNDNTNKSKVILGPALVMLDYDEHVTRLVLSGHTPKVEGIVKTLSLRLGPDFSTDIFNVETSNNAKLQVQISYNWYFRYDPEDHDSLLKMFNVRDCIGEMCRELKSKVVTEVASKTLEEFHKNSARMIRAAIFGMTDGKVNDEYFFPANNLVISNVDIKSVECVDEESRQSLKDKVKMAIQITTDQVEADAKAQADQETQEALGQIAMQVAEDEEASQSFLKSLYDLQNQTNTIKKQGLAIAEAKAKAEAQRIMSESEVKMAEIKAQINTIEKNVDREYNIKKQTLTLDRDTKLKTLEIEKAKALAELESGKFGKIVNAIGADTIVDIANAGPEMQAKLLEGLGLKGYLMMDSKNPINLFQAAEGMIKPDLD